MTKNPSRPTAINTENKMRIIVLTITQYKEKDGIIDAVSEEGKITFLAKGIFDPKNKNASINNILSVADIELNEGNYKYPVLKSASIISSPMKVNSDFYYLSSLMLIAEATKNMLQDEEKERIFNSLLSATEALKKAKQPWEILLVYFAELIKVSGYEFEVNHCVFCGSKQDIVTFSFADGGFVCRNCMQEDTEKELSVPQMFLLRNAFNTRDIGNITFRCEKDDAIKVLGKFVEFISDSIGVTLKSFSLINK